jgi:opacity protein-like surface antigen
MINGLEELMYRRFLLAALMAFALSSAAFAQSVSGAWDLAIQGPEGPISASATLNQDGENVTGSIDTPQGKADMKGTYKGKTLNMAFTIQGPQGPIDIKVNGEVDGASMKGVIDFGMGMAEFTAKKK